MSYLFPYTTQEAQCLMEPPDEEEIRQALFRMRNRKSPGLTNITVEHLKEWYVLSHPNEDSEIPPDEDALIKWNKLVLLINKCLTEGDIPEAFTLGILVLIPKNSEGEVRGIGLLDVIHKLISSIINRRLSETISFCDAVHGFRRRRGCFTAIGETKMKIQASINKNETLFQIYVDLKKAYDSINRSRVLIILKKYGVGSNILRYINILLFDIFK